MNDREGASEAMSERGLEKRLTELEVAYLDEVDLNRDLEREAAELKNDKLLLTGQLKYQRGRNAELGEREGELEGALRCAKGYMEYWPSAEKYVAEIDGALSQANAQAKLETRSEQEEGDGKAD